MEAESGAKASRTRARRSIFRYRTGRRFMADQKTAVEVLLVEDSPSDAELCMRALKRHHLANRLLWVRDGAEALDALFHTGAYASAPDNKLKVVLLDLRLPK